MKKQNYMLDLLIIVSISFAILFISEFCLRAVFPEKVKASKAPKPLAYKFNEDYLVSLKPNMNKGYRRGDINGGYNARWHTNSDSFRGPPLKENPKFRIIVYGDSNIQARFSGFERTYPRQLEKILNNNDLSDLEVINAGVVGFGPDQVLIKMTKEISIYKPNLVIFNVFADNDFGDIIRNRLYSLDENSNLVATDFEKTVDELILDREQEKEKTLSSKLLTVRAFKKFISRFTPESMDKDDAKEAEIDQAQENKSSDERIKLLRENIEQEFLVYKNSKPRKFSHFADHYDLDVATKPEQESSRTKIILMEKIIQKAKKIADSEGVGFIILIQPSAIDLTRYNSHFGYDYLAKYPMYRRTNLSDKIELICANNNIHSINLFEPFYKNNPEDLYFQGGNDHWTDPGQKLAAKITAKYIIDLSLLADK